MHRCSLYRRELIISHLVGRNNEQRLGDYEDAVLVWPVGKGRALLASPFLFFTLSLPLRISDSSSIFSARFSSRHLIIILSGARARLIDAPLHCLPQAHDLTKTLSSSAFFLSFSPLLEMTSSAVEDSSVFWQEQEEKAQ